MQAMTIFVRHVQTPPGEATRSRGSPASESRRWHPKIWWRVTSASSRSAEATAATRPTQCSSRWRSAPSGRSSRPLRGGDLLVRKAIVEIVTRIGRVAVPRSGKPDGLPLVHGAQHDHRPRQPRMPDLAPHVAATLSIPTCV